ncbi:hypothetical protein F4802DRAFT_494153 [Xylaria palmicola]|nr:hypothetical protein F4802DRAFT_494153 [Xylaria palmicola]
MVAQLPDGALAAAVGVQIYSHLCLFCSSLMILLVWKHRERDSYIALFSYSTFLSIVASIAQQLHTIILWNDIKTEQFYYVKGNLGHPEIAIAGPSHGPDLVLFYIQYYFYNVEGLLTLFWAIALSFSIFNPSEFCQYRRSRQKRGLLAKGGAFLLPGLIIGLLQVPAVKESTAAFLALGDAILATSLTLGSVLVVAILAKYIQARRKLHRWTIRYPLCRGSNENTRQEDEQGADSENSIYDGWLIVRFAIALFFIETFQVLTILSEIAQINKNKKESLPAEPDLSASRAQVDFVEFIPGVSAGLLVFLVFGTTRNCRRTLYMLCIPLRFRPSTSSASIPTSTPPLRSSYREGAALAPPSMLSVSRGRSEPSDLRPGNEASPPFSSSCAEVEHTVSQLSRGEPGG